MNINRNKQTERTKNKLVKIIQQQQEKRRFILLDSTTPWKRAITIVSLSFWSWFESNIGTQLFPVFVVLLDHPRNPC